MKLKIFISAAILLTMAICNGQNSSIPNSIIFERKVVQQLHGDGGIGTITYYFTIDGDYAMMKKDQGEEDERATILYTKDGKMCMIDEAEKAIMILNMPATIGSGAAMGKELAEGIKRQPLQKDIKEKISVTKTGKTKTICSFPAYEYEIENDNGVSSWWFIKADFNPVKIYTMGAGSAALVAKMKEKAESMQNNPMAIPVLNINYLWAEIESSGKKGLETISVTPVTFKFSSAGYTIREMGK